jgi:ABC-2 type transport system ATP-binding protein
VAVKRRIGVVTQNNTLDMQLTVSENLQFRSRFFGLPAKVAARRAAQLIDAFGLGDRRNAMADQLSGGQARRLLIARALVHRPDVLFLDEPTAGLDPQTRVNLWEILKVLHDQGQTVLLTTHYMEEAEALCDRVAVVDHGHILAQGTQEQLKEDAGTETIVTVRFEEPIPADFSERTGLGRQPAITRVESEGATLKVFSRDPEGLLGELVALGAGHGLRVLDASEAKPSLETVFLTLTGREYRE